MAKAPPKGGKPWIKADIQPPRREVEQHTPTRMLALRLHGTPGALQKRADHLGLFHQADGTSGLWHEEVVGGALAYGNPDGW